MKVIDPIYANLINCVLYFINNVQMDEGWGGEGGITLQQSNNIKKVTHHIILYIENKRGRDENKIVQTVQ